MVDVPCDDIAIVGGGAAGLATAIFAARRRPSARISLLDGARTLGAKILVSGGGRCNITNRVVTERDFSGGTRGAVRRVLQALPAADAVGFFNGLGVALHEEADGKLFPDTERARTVLDALVGECRALGVQFVPGTRVTGLEAHGERFSIATSAGRRRARQVVLATGGLSLPKSGSDGVGYRLAGAVGHSLVPTTPALVPLVLAPGIHAGLSGTSQRAALTLYAVGVAPPSTSRRLVRIQGSLLWTHFGVSGPAALDLSRHWLRAELEGVSVVLRANLRPPWDFAAADAWLVSLVGSRPKRLLASALAPELPAAVGTALGVVTGVSERTLGSLTRDERRLVAHHLVDLELTVTGSRGYNHAEVTAGGIPLTEVDVSTLESRRCPGLFLVGEMLDADGRLGGFNFQWAWATAYAAARGLAAKG